MSENQSVTSLAEVRDLLLDASKELGKGTDARPLRRVQRRLEMLQHSECDPDLRFLAYFLCVFIDDYFYNLAGDLQYSKEFNAIQHESVLGIGKVLGKLGENFDSKDATKWYECYRELAIEYLQSIRKGNELELSAEDECWA